MSIEQILFRKPGQESRNRFPNADFRCIWVRVRRVLCSRSWHRDSFRGCGAVGRVLLEARVAGEFVTHFDDVVFVGLEEEANVGVVDYRARGVFAGFLGGETDVGVDPGLGG